MNKTTPLQLYFLTFIALIAFAANSVICRIALKELYIDPASFTFIRLLSGAITLIILVLFMNKTTLIPLNVSIFKRYLLSSLMLLIYALAFSYAYIALDAATGAFILFGFVQLTIVIVAFLKGRNPALIDLLGLVLAMLGLLYLMYPALQLPSWKNFLLMVISGIAWGAYSLLGKSSHSPLIDTSYNFIFTIPLILLFILFNIEQLHLSIYGSLLAVLSGSCMSALGYALWYLVIHKFNDTQIGILQLLVPVFAAILGFYLIDENINERLLFSGLMILIGILLTILPKKRLIS